MAFVSIFFASLLGSLHCAAMCGGFSLYCAGQSKSRAAAQIYYNFGRLISYSLLGALAGYGGSLLNSAAELAGIQKAAALIAGLALILWGTLSLVRPKTFLVKAPPSLSFSRRLFGSTLSSAKEQSGNWRAGLIGLLSILLPCGWLYMFVGVAAATADPLHGMLAMAVFWGGTVPALAAFGGLSEFLVKKLGSKLPKVTATLIVIAGIFSLSGHIWPSMIGLDALHKHHHHQNSDQHNSHSHHHAH